MPKSHNLAGFVLCFLSLISAAAQETSTQAKFAGTWEASFKGTVFCVLKINAADGISGVLSPGKISVNDQGDLTDAEPSSPDGAFPILNPKIEGAKLSFEWKDDDGETLKFEMKTIGEKEGELRFLGEDGSRIKPIRLRKAQR